MSGRAEYSRQEVIKSGSPLVGHSMSQKREGWVLDGERRMEMQMQRGGTKGKRAAERKERRRKEILNSVAVEIFQGSVTRPSVIDAFLKESSLYVTRRDRFTTEKGNPVEITVVDLRRPVV